MGLIYTVVALGRRSSRFALFAALATNAGLWALLHHRSWSFLVHPQFWLIPLALIALVAEHLNRERGRAGEVCVTDLVAGRSTYRHDPKGAAGGLWLSADGGVLVWYDRVPGGFEVHVRRHAEGKTLVLRGLPQDSALCT